MSQYEGVPPLLQNLIRNLRVTPTAAEVAEMKKTDVKELRIFFDALASGQSERDTYEKILDHVRNRGTAEQRRAAEEAAKAQRAAEEELRKKKALEDAAKAKADAARQAEEVARKKAEEEEVRRRQIAERERLEKEAEQQRLAALEAKRKAAEEAERARRRVGTCAHCKEFIEDRDFLENGDMKLHTKCLEGYQIAHSPKCAHCTQPVTDDYVEINGATVHPNCLDDFKRATRPKCAKCGETIMENSRMTLGGDSFHVKCAPPPK